MTANEKRLERKRQVANWMGQNMDLALRIAAPNYEANMFFAALAVGIPGLIFLFSV